jgi:hypothetical protein
LISLDGSITIKNILFILLLKILYKKKICDTFKTLEDFEKYLLIEDEDRLDEDTDCEDELIDELHTSHVGDLNIFKITHDIMVTDEIIVGSCVLLNNITQKKKKNSDLKFSWRPGELETKVLLDKLIQDFDIHCKYYSIRDDCTCCS